MTAAMAEDDREASYLLWRVLDEAGQLDVLRALGAQARNALRGIDYDLDMTVLAGGRGNGPVTPEVPGVIAALLRNEPFTPPCVLCRAAAAVTAATAAVEAGRAAGLSAELIAHHCREAAARVAAP